MNVGRLNQCVSETANNEYVTSGVIDENKGAALMVFTNIGLGEQSAKNRGFDMKAWIEKASWRVVLSVNTLLLCVTIKRTQKEKLFDDMRQGKNGFCLAAKIWRLALMLKTLNICFI